MATTNIHAAPSVGMLLLKLGRSAQRQCTAALKPGELTPRHIAALFELRGGPMPQQALGDAVGADPSKLVGILNDLEAEKLVVRQRDPEDRRRHIVALADEGDKRLAEAERQIAAVEERLLSGLTEEQRAQLAELLMLVKETSGLDPYLDEPLES
jgi:DNA-binding MarR family transcriptional regulator